MKLSIAIPTYECHGRGAEFLDYSLARMSAQTFKDFQVVITDDSLDDDIEKFCDRNPHGLNIKYVRNPTKSINFSQNTNRAIMHSDGEIVKILYQDDFLYGPNSLMQIVQAFHDDTRWLVSSCMHTYNDGVDIERRHDPSYHPYIHHGTNTIGCPSVLAIRKSNNIFFDERLVWLMDVEYYKRLHDAYGPPHICHGVTSVVRIWNNQLSQTMKQEIKDAEYAIVRSTHDERAR